MVLCFEEPWISMRLWNNRALTWQSQGGPLLESVSGSKWGREPQHPQGDLHWTVEDQDAAANRAKMPQEKWGFSIFSFLTLEVDWTLWWTSWTLGVLEPLEQGLENDWLTAWIQLAFVNSFIGTQIHPFISELSVSALTLQWQCRVAVTEIMYAKPKIFTLRPCTEK